MQICMVEQRLIRSHTMVRRQTGGATMRTKERGRVRGAAAEEWRSDGDGNRRRREKGSRTNLMPIVAYNFSLTLIILIIILVTAILPPVSFLLSGEGVGDIQRVGGLLGGEDLMHLVLIGSSRSNSHGLCQYPLHAIGTDSRTSSKDSKFLHLFDDV